MNNEMEKQIKEKRIENWGKEWDNKFEWTDFSGDIGCCVLAKKIDSYSIEKTEREELKSFIRRLLAQEKRKLIQNIIKFVESGSGKSGRKEIIIYLLQQ